jgi:hypothetical protein
VPAAGRAACGAYSGFGGEGGEQRLHDGLHAALERLEHHVAGEAVGDDDVDVVGHDVAALDVADEVDARRAPSSS